MKDVRQQDRRARWLVAGIIVCVLGCMAAIVVAKARAWRVFPQAKLVPKQIQLQAGDTTRVAETDCYGFLLSKDFEITNGSDCSLNAYARPQKYRYVNVSPYFDTPDEPAALAKWRERWLTLQAQEASREQVTVGGKKAWKITETYPQNSEKFVTYLVVLTRPVPVTSKSPITALEIRGWASQPEDTQLLESVINSWQWRF